MLEGNRKCTKALCVALRRSPKLTHPYSPKVTQAFGTDPASARDDHDGTSRCRRSGRSHVESAAGGSSRTREWETGSERAASWSVKPLGGRRRSQTGESGIRTTASPGD